ncbi:unnamed protein product [Rhizoctonia solani]|uniref:DUF2235 domain-containing protein n=1 Tax=Rhizoctonia solani TaxID=456999 RepID=A0A8H2XBX0_9AGAM|nr:unnamed protein product [Rhizoctonia solani]
MPVTFSLTEQIGMLEVGPVPVLTASPVSESLDLSSPFYVPPHDLPTTLSPPEPKRTPSTRYKHPTRSHPVPKSSFPQVIPPENHKRSRTLALCFDGTGDQYDQDVNLPACVILV